MRTDTALAFLLSAAAGAGFGESTVAPDHPYAYGANIGWINLRGDGTNGAALGQSFCTGYLWSANAGWICLGKGPTNGWEYSNESAADWGVNHDGQGRLYGYAYGANVGWILFEQSYGRPMVDLLTGNLSGYAWGANIGWISLSNAQAYGQTERLDPGPDTDGDGLPDPWEYRRAGNLTRLSGSGHDDDGDGSTDAEEYAADTDPTKGLSQLRVTDLQEEGGTNRVTWTVEPTRLYRLEKAGQVPGPGWADSGLGLMAPDPASTMTREVNTEGYTTRFYRAKAVVPLSP